MPLDYLNCLLTMALLFVGKIETSSKGKSRRVRTMTNIQNADNKTVITGRETVKFLGLSTLCLIVSIILSSSVIWISCQLFGIADVNAATLGGKIGLLVWLVCLGFLIGKNIKKKKA